MSITITDPALLAQFEAGHATSSSLRDPDGQYRIGTFAADAPRQAASPG